MANDKPDPIAPRHEDSVSSEPPARQNNAQNDKTSSRTPRPST